MTFLLFIGIVLLVVLSISLVSFSPFIKKASSSEAYDLEEANSLPLQGYVVVLCLGLLISGGAGSLYYMLGEPKVLTQAWLTEATEEKQLGTLLAEVEKKVSKNPENIEAWLILARGQMILEDYKKATESLENAYRLAGDDVEVMVRLADAYTMNNNGKVSQEALDLLLKAYDFDPLHNSLLWLLAIAYEQRDRINESVSYWLQLEALLDEESELKGQVRRQIERLRAIDISYSIRITVADKLKESLDSSASLFVFASEKDGPPMPIAAIRLKASDLPVTVTLDNGDSLSKQRLLSQFKEIKITARISDEATPQSGDLYGTVSMQSSQAEIVHEIEINQIHGD